MSELLRELGLLKEQEDPYSGLRSLGLIKTVEVDSPEQEQEVANVERGTLGDIFSKILRGGAAATRLYGKGLEGLGVDNSIASTVDKATSEYDILKPDLQEAYGDSWVSDAVKSVPGELVKSLGTTAPGAIAGGMIGSTVLPGVGTAIGAGIGGFANMFLTFGSGTYQEEYDRNLSHGLDPDSAKNKALLSAGSALASESISTGVDALTLGSSKLFTTVAKQGVKTTVANALEATLSPSFKRTAGTMMLSEQIGELSDYIVQEKLDESYGMGEGVTARGLGETAIVTAGMSMLFAGAAHRYNTKQRDALEYALTDGTADQQQAAANLIYKNLAKDGDNIELANSWRAYSSSFIKNGLPIYLDEEFVSVGHKIEGVGVGPSDILSSNPDVQMNAVNKVLEQHGIDSATGSLIGPEFNQEEQDVALFTQEVEAYRASSNTGNKAQRRATEIQQGRQEIEAKQAARQQLGVQTEDPVKILEQMYQDQELRRYLPPVQYANIQSESTLLALEKQYEDDLNRQFEEATSKYLKEKNQKRTIEDFLQSPDNQRKLEMLSKMLELTPDTNNVEPTKALDAIKKKEDVEIKKNEEVVSKGIKGSKKVKEAKAKIEEIKVKQEVREEIREAVSPTVTTDGSKGESLYNQLKSNLVKDEVTVEDQYVGEEGSREAATNLTPEDILQNKQETEVFLKENPDVVEGLEGYDYAEFEKEIGRTEDPLLGMLINGDTEGVKSLLSKTPVNKRVGVVKESFSKIGKDTYSKYKDAVSELMRRALPLTKTDRVRDIKGSKKEDIVKWERSTADKRATTQTGVHKETGQSVEVNKVDIGLNAKGEMVEGKDLWEVNIDNQIIDTVEGKVAARRLIEEYFKGQEFGEGPRKLPTAAVKHLDRVNWDLDKALEIAKTSRDEKAVKELEEMTTRRDSNMSEWIGKVGSPSAILNSSSKSSNKFEKAIAKLILSSTKKDKLGKIKIVINPKVKRSSYNSKTNTITLNTDNTTTALHELIHAVTVNELAVDHKLGVVLDKIRAKALGEAVNSGIITYDQSLQLKSVSTSKDFYDLDIEFNSSSSKSLAYALLNNQEFLSQALTNESVMEFLKGVEVERSTGIIKTLWDKIVAIVGKALGISSMHHSALSEALTVAVKLMDSTSSRRIGGIYGEDIQEEKALKVRESIGKDIKRLESGELKESWKELVDKYSSRVSLELSKTFRSTYDKLAEYSLPIAEKIRHLDADKMMKEHSRVKKVTPFVEMYRKLSPAKREQLSYYLANYNNHEEYRIALNQFLSKTTGALKSFNSMVDVLKEIHEDAEKFGLNKYDEVDHYFPRRVKDINGLLAYMREQEDWGFIDEALKLEEDKAKKEGKALSDRDRADLVGKMLATGRLPTSYLRTPAGTKKRSIKRVNPAMLKFYYNPMEALSMHISEMTERIEINRMLGITDRSNVIKEIRQKDKALRKLIRDKAKDSEINAASLEVQKLKDKLPDMAQEIDGSIGDIVARLVKDRKIASEEQGRVQDLIRARITQVGVGKIMGGIRQAALLSSLTQLGTGLKQLSDNAWTMYQAGVFPTLAAAIKVGTGGSVVKENFIDFQSPLKEFHNDTHRWVDTALKMSGLQVMDNFSKKVSMEANLGIAKKMSKEDFVAKWKDVFPEENQASKLYEDINKNNITPDVKYYLLSNIANFQPIFLSEKSQRELTAGNARILWFLKSYAIKSANNFHRESIAKIKEGNVKEGLYNLAVLGSLFVALGAGSDWLVDWLNGKNPHIEDSVLDSLLTIGLTSRFGIDKVKKEGLIKSQAGSLFPPSSIVDLPFKDLYNLLTGSPTVGSVKLIPGFGTTLYNRWTEEGARKVIEGSKRYITSEIQDGNTPSEEISDVNEAIRNYNSRFEPEKKMEFITPGKISAVRNKKEKSVKRGLF